MKKITLDDWTISKVGYTYKQYENKMQEEGRAEKYIKSVMSDIAIEYDARYGKRHKIGMIACAIGFPIIIILMAWVAYEIFRGISTL